jgi:[ribosomal protein S5]-alanine N-acetyltransferase
VSTPAVALRALGVEDAAELARLYTAERTFLEPFEPSRSPEFFTVAGQRRLLERTTELREVGLADRFAIVADGELVGVLGVSNIVRGVFESASIGYFVAQSHNGRGIATRAVAAVCAWAFDEAGLHRLEAGTLTDNLPSQRVLERNGFRCIGVANGYLRINGVWRDHVLFERLAGDTAPT